MAFTMPIGFTEICGRKKKVEYRDFINFVTNYFRKHLVEKITFGAVKTMRDFFLPLISKAVTDGA